MLLELRPMPSLLKEASGSVARDYFRENNLDLMRLILASSVFVHHLYGVSRAPELEMLHISSLFAVQGFFVISGFLVGKSYESSRSVWSFYEKRLRRVYPAYAFVVIVTFVALYAFSDKAFLDYLRSGIRYLVFQLTFMNFVQESIPGVFSENPISAVNGALWTLKIEMMFYAIVPLIMMLIRRWDRAGQAMVLVLLYAASMAYREGLEYWAGESGRGIFLTLAKQLPGQLAFFLVGVGIYVFFNELKRVISWVGPLALVAFLLLDRHSVLRPLALGLGVIYLGIFFRYLGNWGRHGDFSYGIYIWHFPLIQTFVALGIFGDSPALAVLLVATAVLAAAVISWRYVERPFLLKKSHYVAAETENSKAHSGGLNRGKPDV